MVKLASKSDVDELLTKSIKNDGDLFWLNDQVYWSPDKNKFVVAYDIEEISNNNPVGSFLWGNYDGVQSQILGMPELRIFCSHPVFNWITNEIFIFKISYKNNYLAYFYPLIAIHVFKGFYVIPDSHEIDLQPKSITKINGEFRPFSESIFRKVLDNYPYKIATVDDSWLKRTLCKVV